MQSSPSCYGRRCKYNTSTIQTAATRATAGQFWAWQFVAQVYNFWNSSVSSFRRPHRVAIFSSLYAAYVSGIRPVCLALSTAGAAVHYTVNRINMSGVMRVARSWITTYESGMSWSLWFMSHLQSHTRCSFEACKLFLNAFRISLTEVKEFLSFGSFLLLWESIANFWHRLHCILLPEEPVAYFRRQESTHHDSRILSFVCLPWRRNARRMHATYIRDHELKMRSQFNLIEDSGKAIR